MFMNLLSHSLTNQTPLCISTNQKIPIEALEPRKINNNYHEVFLSFHSITVLSKQALPFTKTQLVKIAHRYWIKFSYQVE